VWHGRLPVAEMLAVAATFQGMLEAEDDTPLCIGDLSNGKSVDAPTVEQLRSDLSEVSDDEVTRLSIGIGSRSTTEIWLGREPTFDRASASRSATRLKVTGTDETKVGTLFAALERTITEHFERIEAERQRRIAEEEEERLAKARAIEAARAPEPTKPKAPVERPWWDPWLIGIAGGTLAAVIVGLGLALIIH
jgi:hypothetical protein